ncbi:Regulator of chromosome condensation (RCC1) repeat protein [compost metagenome]
MNNHMSRNVVVISFGWILIAIGLSGCTLDVQILESLANNNHQKESILLKAYGDANCVKKPDSAPVCFGSGQGFISFSYEYPLKSEEIAVLKAGFNQTCVVTTSGRAFCWGSNNGYGQLGNGGYVGTLVPVEVKKVGALAGKKIIDIAMGDHHACALDSQGGLACWGRNTNVGQLGDGTFINSRIPVAVDFSGALAGKNIVSISGHGSDHTCVLDDQGKAYCWGANSKGQLGNNDIVDSGVPVAVHMSGVLAGKTLVQIETGRTHTCAIANDKKAYCWGENTNGALGTNISGATLSYSEVPRAVYADAGVLASKNVVALQAGLNLTCALTEDGILACWGNDGSGQLGNGGSNTHAMAPSAVNVSGALAGQTVSDIYVGFYHACALTVEAKAYCWGSNHYGYLGDGTQVGKNEPSEVLFSNLNYGDGLNALALENYQSCGLTSERELYCWGSGSLSSPGNITLPTLYKWDSSSFADDELKYIRSMSLSSTHTCYLSSSYRVFCSGSNNKGQLGNGTAEEPVVPSAIDTSGALIGKKITDIVTASLVSYALSEDGDLFAWGDNSNGHLADEVISQSQVPVAVSFGAIKVKQVVSSDNHACALLKNNEVYCWGDNIVGELGDGTSGPLKKTPTRVEGLPNGKKIVSLSASSVAHTCVLTEEGRAYCWGYNGSGQLGHGDPEMFSAVPVEVSWTSDLQGHKFKSLALAGQSTCALTEQGKTYCWGLNAQGQLGVALITYSLVPVAVETDKSFTQIIAGANHFCGWTLDKKMYCWGANDLKQLGDLSFTTGFSESPRLVIGL